MKGGLWQRWRVVVSAWLGCTAASAVAAAVAATLTAGPKESSDVTFVRGMYYWGGMETGPFAAMLGPRGFLAHPTTTTYAIWSGLLAFVVACIFAHPVGPGRRSAAVSTLGVVLWFFLALVLGMWNV